jgi:hypothetical protein
MTPEEDTFETTKQRFMRLNALETAIINCLPFMPEYADFLDCVRVETSETASRLNDLNRVEVTEEDGDAD